MRLKASEASIQAAICHYLTLRKHLFFRVNNVPMYDGKQGVYRKMGSYALKGVPDIIVIDHGFIGIEVKAEGGRLSPEQKAFAARCMEKGGEYLVARSVRDVQLFGL